MRMPPAKTRISQLRETQPESSFVVLLEDDDDDDMIND